MLDDKHSFIFVTGIHRAGTSPLHRCLRDHPQISGFHDTGVAEDEGQHLQTVLPRGGAYGGPGRFARHPDAHMTEEHPLANPTSAEGLFAQWQPYWDLTRPYLIEKTPITLTRTRLFQALFPNSYFVVILRHPIPVALATYNAWLQQPITRGGTPPPTVSDMVENWLAGYTTFTEDAPYLQRVQLVRYEEFAENPQDTLDTIYRLLGLPSHPCSEEIRPHIDDKYQQQWNAMRNDPVHRADIEQAMRCDDRIQPFGYTLS